MQQPYGYMSGSPNQWDDWNRLPSFRRSHPMIGNNGVVNLADYSKHGSRGAASRGPASPATGALITSSFNAQPFFSSGNENAERFYGDQNFTDGNPEKSRSEDRKRRKSMPDSEKIRQEGDKPKLGKKVTTGVAIIKALVARSMFLAHGTLVVWRVLDILDNDWPWLLLSLVGLVFIETLVIVCVRKGRENRWFSLCIFLFLCSTVPGLWLLEIDRLDRYKTGLETNVTVKEEAEALSAISGVQLPVVLEADLWVLALEQMLLFILIIARWILPKGNISRSQLSVLLLVYIGMASDIMDIFVLYEEPEVLHAELLGYIILAVWSFSLLQFCLTLTVTKARRPRVALTKPDSPGQKDPGCKCCETEIWSIFTTIFMQDGPFLALRLYIMIKYDTFNYSLLFFSFKNALVILLQLYRLMIVLSEEKSDKVLLKSLQRETSTQDLYRYI